MDFMALTRRPDAPEPPRFRGFFDAADRYVTFEAAEEVFERAHGIGARVLLRLTLEDDGRLIGALYTNERGVTPRGER